MRFTAFMITSAGTGIAAALFNPVVQFAGPTAFDVELSMLFFFAIIVGGRGHLLGPVLGMALLFLVPNVFLASFVKYRLFIYGAIALGVMLAFPNGLVGSFEDWRRRKRKNVEPLNLQIMQVMGDGAGAADVKDAGPAIEVTNGTKRFGHVIALDAVNVKVARGEIHGLIGANGSGKTSLLNVLSGFSACSNEGDFTILGAKAQGYPAPTIAKLELGRTFQTPRVFPALDAPGKI